MDDDDDVGNGSAAVVELGAQILKVLDAESVAVTLRNGNVVNGSLLGSGLRKKKKKGSGSWIGKLSVETDSGMLEMDFSNIASIKAG